MKIPGPIFIIIGAAMVLMSVFISVEKLSFFILSGAIFIVYGFFKIITNEKKHNEHHAKMLKHKQHAKHHAHPATHHTTHHPHTSHHQAQNTNHNSSTHHSNHTQHHHAHTTGTTQHPAHHQTRHTQKVVRCSGCGVKLHPQFKFCPSCGQKL